jgi:endonuclease/exonuclease/phosphatase family metal-dependent hydrolase
MHLTHTSRPISNDRARRATLRRGAVGAALCATITALGCVAAPPDDLAIDRDEAAEGSATSASITDPNSAVAAAAPPLCAYTGTPPAAVGARRAVARVLTHNVFGLSRDGREACSERGRSFGSQVANAAPAYDIVTLQEHWNTADFGLVDCDAEGLTNALWSTGRYRNSNNYYRYNPHGEVREFETDGGQSIFTLHPIEAFDEYEWDDIPRDHGIKTLQGVTFSRIHLNWTDVRLDVYNVHLLAGAADGCPWSCRAEELKKLREVIKKNSATSGNPVLVLGDFNIGGPPSCQGNESYGSIMSALGNPRDLWLENRAHDNGYTVDCERNSVLQSQEHCSYHERIDYMFAVTDPALTNARQEIVVRNPWDIKVVEFRRAGGGPVSDHWGLEATLEFRDKGIVRHSLKGLANKCIDVQGGRTDDGTPIQLFDCNGSDAQLWTIRPNGDIRGRAGKCLTIRGGNAVDGAVTELRTCNGGDAQRFDYTAAGELRSRLDASKCIEVRGGFTQNTTPIQVYSCNGTASQLWR